MYVVDLGLLKGYLEFGLTVSSPFVERRLSAQTDMGYFIVAVILVWQKQYMESANQKIIIIISIIISSNIFVVALHTCLYAHIYIWCFCLSAPLHSEDQKIKAYI